MTDTGQQKAVTAAFPPPPPFWKHFTTKNLDKLEEYKKNAQEKDNEAERGTLSWSPEALRTLELPTELQCLVPPEPPASGSYSLFGETQTISTSLPPLRDQGIEPLYPPTLEENGTGSESGPSKPSNHASYLLKISKSLLLNFLELVGLLSVNPERFEPKLEDIRHLFINAHHLLNLYRPHQARESLILMMEEQLQRTRDEIQEMDKVKGKVEALLRDLETEGREAGKGVAKHEEGEGSLGSRPQDAEVEARKMWDLLNSIDET